MEKNLKRTCMYVCITELFFCTPEMNETLSIYLFEKKTFGRNEIQNEYRQVLWKFYYFLPISHYMVSCTPPLWGPLSKNKGQAFAELIPGTSDKVPWSRLARLPSLLSLCFRALEPRVMSPCATATEAATS